MLSIEKCIFFKHEESVVNDLCPIFIDWILEMKKILKAYIGNIGRIGQVNKNTFLYNL